VRVQRDRAAGVVAQDDLDRVADLGVDHRAEHPEVPPCGALVEAGRERRVGVAAEQRLAVHRADPVGTAGGEHLRVLAERLAGRAVAAVRRVVPDHLLGLDEVAADLPAVVGGVRRGAQQGDAHRGRKQGGKRSEERERHESPGHGPVLYPIGAIGVRVP
jgi:hypothetical protein